MTALGTPRYITVHCAATPEGRDVKAGTISKWDIERFGQVSYHFVIELDGNVENTLPLNKLGAHVGKHNTGNIGVCYVGGMDKNNAKPKDTRTELQRAAMAGLIKALLHEFPGTKILGHRDWPGVNKACPSFDVKSWMGSEEFTKYNP